MGYNKTATKWLLSQSRRENTKKRENQHQTKAIARAEETLTFPPKQMGKSQFKKVEKKVHDRILTFSSFSFLLVEFAPLLSCWAIITSLKFLFKIFCFTCCSLPNIFSYHLPPPLLSQNFLFLQANGKNRRNPRQILQIYFLH